MLRRFALYGFLKNQQYYEPFLILAFREKGLSFLQIGLLIGFREICINLFEIPSGAVADMYGRRRAMIGSMLAYCAAFVVFAVSEVFGLLFAAMLFFALGEAFRTGTHKAMIFEWLRQEQRTHEKTRVYGYTRSWSKIGSAVSVLIAAALVFSSGRYSPIFWFSIPPYLLNVLNFLGYPASLDGTPERTFSLRRTALSLWQTLRTSAHNRALRRLFVETMGFEGTYKVTKDYLQPILKRAALGLPLLVGLDGRERTAVLVGIVYVGIYVLATTASRHAFRFVAGMGGEHQAANGAWKISGLLFMLLLPALWLRFDLLAILGFVALDLLQNLWRPVQVTRFDTYSDTGQGATILSIDSQAKSVFTMLAAPVLGFVVDCCGFWPVGLLGAVLAVAAVLTSPWHKVGASEDLQ